MAGRALEAAVIERPSLRRSLLSELSTQFMNLPGVGADHEITYGLQNASQSVWTLQRGMLFELSEEVSPMRVPHTWMAPARSASCQWWITCRGCSTNCIAAETVQLSHDCDAPAEPQA